MILALLVSCVMATTRPTVKVDLGELQDGTTVTGEGLRVTSQGGPTTVAVPRPSTIPGRRATVALPGQQPLNLMAVEEAYLNISEPDGCTRLLRLQPSLQVGKAAMFATEVVLPPVFMVDFVVSAFSPVADFHRWAPRSVVPSEAPCLDGQLPAPTIRVEPMKPRLDTYVYGVVGKATSISRDYGGAAGGSTTTARTEYTLVPLGQAPLDLQLTPGATPRIVTSTGRRINAAGRSHRLTIPADGMAHTVAIRPNRYWLNVGSGFLFVAGVLAAGGGLDDSDAFGAPNPLLWSGLAGITVGTAGVVVSRPKLAEVAPDQSN
jgi:hypothetical protein